MKKIISIIVLIIILVTSTSIGCISAYAVPIAASGSCGTNTTWKIDKNGVLVISGNGPVTAHPWWTEREAYLFVWWPIFKYEIKEVIVEEGITSICAEAFRSCSSLTSLTLPKSLKKIEPMAFEACDNLKSEIELSKNFERLGGGAFGDTPLKSLTIKNPACKIVDKGWYGGVEYDEDPMFGTYDLNYRGTIYGFDDSTAQEYCFNSGATFISLDSAFKDFYNEIYIQTVKDYIDSNDFKQTINEKRWAKIISEGTNSTSDKVSQFCWNLVHNFGNVITLKFKDMYISGDCSTSENPYDLIITEMICSSKYIKSFGSLFDKYIQKDSKVAFETVEKIFQNDSDWSYEGFDLELEIPHIVDAKAYDENNAFHKAIGNYLKAKGKDKFTFFNGISFWKQTVEMGGDISTLVDAFIKCMNYKIAIDAFADANSIYIDFFKEMANVMGSDNQYFTDTINKYVSFAQSDCAKDALYEKIIDEGLKVLDDVALNDIFKETSKSMIYYGFVNILKMGQEAAKQVASKLYAAIWAYDTGLKLADMLTNIDDKMQCQTLLHADGVFEDTAKIALDNIIYKFNNSQTITNARLVDNAIEILKMAELYSLDKYTKLLQADQDALINAPISWYRNKILNLNSNYRDHTEEIGAVVELKADWEKVGITPCMRERILDEINRFDTYVVACPTDVFVYDKLGNTVVEIVNNKIKKRVDCEAIVVNDIKSVCIPADEEYTLKIVSTADGTMDYYTKTYDSNRNESFNCFTDLTIKKNDYFDDQRDDKHTTLIQNGTDAIISDTCTDFDPSIISTNTNIERVSVSPDNELYSEMDGVLYNKSKESLIAYPKGKKDSAYTIPESVKYISPEAFYTNSNLSQVVLPLSLQGIGTDAFKSCTKLDTVNFKGTIDEWVNISFENEYSNPCNCAQNLYLNEKLLCGDVSISKDISNFAFVGLSNITSITFSDEVKKIGKYAFLNCYGLTKLVIPGNVSEIGMGSFKGCNNLVSVNIPFVGTSESATGSDSVFGSIFGSTSSSTSGTTKQSYDSSNSSYYYIPSTLKSVTITKATKIPYGTFENCSMITDLSIPKSVASVGENAFRGCTGLKKLSIPFVGSSRTSTGYSSTFGYPFGYSSSSVDGYTSQYYESSKCYYYNIPSSIEDVEITDQSTIPYGAFYNCSKIKNIRLNKVITDISTSAFFGLSGMENVYFDGSLEEWCNINCTSYRPNYYANHLYINGELLQGELVIPSTITNVPSYAFAGATDISSIKFNSSLSSVGANAFTKCNGLNRVEFEGTLDEWMNITFMNCFANPNYYANNLIVNGLPVSGEITIPENVTSIPDASFAGCNDITKINFSENITSIGNYAFYSCKALTEIVIPDSVKSIGSNAFAYCNNVSEITLGKEITEIDDSAFKSCSNLKTVNYNCTNCTYAGFCPILGPNQYAVFANCSKLSNFNIGNNVTQLPNNLLNSCSSIKNITIPQSVTYIGNRAFYCCTGLESVYYEGTLDNWCGIVFKNSYSNPCYYADNLYCDGKLVSGDITIATDVNNYALYNSASITNVTLTDNVKKIGNCAFQKCTSLKNVTIPDNVTYIGSYAFSGDSNIESFSLPKSLTTIGDAAFQNCTSLKNITIPDNVTYIGSYAFLDDSNIESFSLPKSLTTIGNGAFKNCALIDDIVVPENVTNIGASAFYGCNNLQRITLPFVGTSESATGSDSVFGSIFGSTSSSTSGTTKQSYDSSNSSYYYIPSTLKSVTITKATKIPYGTFENCSMITDLSIPKSVASVGENAFRGCTGLKKLSIPFVGSSRTSTGYSSTFGYPFGYSSSSVDGYTSQYYESSKCYYYNIPSSIEDVEITDQSTIPYGAFYNCSKIKNIRLNKVITDISTSAFFGLSGMENVYFDGSLEEWCNINCTSYRPNYYANHLYINGELLQGELVIPSTITNVPSYAFAGATDISSIKLSSKLSSVGADAFTMCTGLSKVDFDGTLDDWVDIRFTNYASNPVYFAHDLYIGGVKLSGKIVLPEKLNVVPNSVFAGCNGITEVILNDNITSIEQSAFDHCTNLAVINIPETVTKICEYAFDGCSGLAEVTIPNGVTNVPRYAFRNCTSLKKLTVSSECTYGRNSFSGCENIESITLTCKNGIMPNFSTSSTNSSKSFRNTPWYISDAINEIIIEDGVKRIGDNAFRGTHASKINVPTSVKEIGSNAFYNCSKLGEITIPAGTNSIGTSAFSNNTTIKCYKNSPAYLYAVENSLMYELLDVIFEKDSGNIRIDNAAKNVYGFVDGLSSLINDTTVSDGYTMSYDAAERVFTGMKIQIKDSSSNVVEEYSAVLFGDVNGDGWYDGRDAVTVSMIANGMLTREQVGEAVWMAADCNHDGKIDQADVDLLNQAGLLLSSVDQTKPTEELLKTSSEYNEYLNLIDQSVEVKSDEPEQESPETQKPSLLEFLLTTIWNYIKLILSLIK